MKTSASAISRAAPAFASMGDLQALPFTYKDDLRAAQEAADGLGVQLGQIAKSVIFRRKQDDVAVLMLTHVNYRTGAMHDMQAVTAQAHAQGILTVWDLAHSAGAVPVDLHAAQADFAVGCGYKYLNGGPGAPAFVWAHPRHAGRPALPAYGARLLVFKAPDRMRAVVCTTGMTRSVAPTSERARIQSSHG